ncbi:MAG TPA: substrate-binding domain-containing protein [Chloroflexota bacterium]
MEEDTRDRSEESTEVDEQKGISRGTFLKAAAGVAAASSLYGPGKVFADGPYAFTRANRFTIAIVPKSLQNPVFALANLGGKKRAQELGVNYVFTASAQESAATDINIIQGLIQRKVSAIGVSCIDPKAYAPVLNHAVDSGIKVMTWDADSPQSKRAVFYGINSRQIGSKMARAMNRLTGGKGKIVIVSGDASALNLNERIAGARAALAPGIQVVNVLYTNDDIPSAISQTESAIRAHPDLAGILMVGGWALFSNEGATPLLKQHAGKIKVVSFDPIQPVVAYLRDNIAQSVWTQDYWGWGYQSVTILHGLLMGKKWRKVIPQPSHEVTPAQWQIWQRRWAASSSGNVNAAAKVWGEKPFTPPGP